MGKTTLKASHAKKTEYPHPNSTFKTIQSIQLNKKINKPIPPSLKAHMQVKQ